MNQKKNYTSPINKSVMAEFLRHTEGIGHGKQKYPLTNVGLLLLLRMPRSELVEWTGRFLKAEHEGRVDDLVSEMIEARPPEPKRKVAAKTAKRAPTDLD